MGSVILAYEPAEFARKLNGWLPNTGNWKACWRATRDGWAASTFHNNCTGKKPTLVIVKVVKNAKNLVFGGYSTITWDGSKFQLITIYRYYLHCSCIIQILNFHP